MGPCSSMLSLTRAGSAAFNTQGPVSLIRVPDGAVCPPGNSSSCCGCQQGEWLPPSMLSAHGTSPHTLTLPALCRWMRPTRPPVLCWSSYLWGNTVQDKVLV